VLAGFLHRDRVLTGSANGAVVGTSSAPAVGSSGRAKHSAVIVAATAVWLGATMVGFLVVIEHSTTAYAEPSAPRAWPAESSIACKAGAPALVLFLHPRCPCSSATLGELSRLLTRAAPGSSVTIAFFSPTSQPAEWGRGSLRSRAESIPGVRVVNDVDGEEARRFGAMYSGCVCVYGSDGSLRFKGGITASRGHEGDNLGADCVVAALNGRLPTTASTPTFGCDLMGGVAECPLCVGEER
jgi:hypothetical protein